MRKLLIVLLVLTCVLGLTACLRLPQYLPCAEDAFYEAYPKNTVINIEKGTTEITLFSTITDKYGAEYDVAWRSSDDELAMIEEREEGVFALLAPTTEDKEFTLTATISDDDGDTVKCTVTYSLYECVHKPGAAATCTTEQKCTECGKVLAEAKGHKPGAAATCTEPQKCTVCKTVLAKALGHKPAQDDGDCTTEVKCTRCGAVTTEAKANHVDGNVDGKCDACTVVIGINIDNDAVRVAVTYSTVYNFSGVERISGSNIKVYTNSTKASEITLPYDLNGDESLYIEVVGDNAELHIGDRVSIPVNEFEVGVGRELVASTDGYVTHFMGYEGSFAFYFGEDVSYGGCANIDVQVSIDGGEFKSVQNRYTFTIRENQVISFKLSAKNGEQNVQFVIFPVPAENMEYRLGITVDGVDHYFTGRNANGVESWLQTSANAQDAVKVMVEASGDSYKLYFIKDDVKQYISMYSSKQGSGRRAGLEITTDASKACTFTYDAEYRTLVFTDEFGAYHFLGAAPGSNVIASCQWGNIAENSIVHLFLY